MRIVLFCHSLVSDWNHGNAHFLRGVVRELSRRGHRVDVFEPEDGWSLNNLRTDASTDAEAFSAVYPDLLSTFYDPAAIDLDEALAGSDLVIVHEWSDHGLVHRISEHRRRHGYKLLFHDTHHRAVTAPQSMGAYDLSSFDGVLAFGEVLRRLYLDRGWVRAAWTWHEAADTSIFRPITADKAGDIIWVGNWGDDERARELEEYLIAPARALGLRTTVHGVRYPDAAKQMLSAAGIVFSGHIANHRVPEVFARHRATLHVPRRPYVEALPGIPTIRVFEALACGIPLVSAPWQDTEDLFTPGQDFLMARDGAEMRRHIQAILAEPDAARAMAGHGLETILSRHTCAHRVDQLLDIAADELGLDTSTDEERLECAMG